MATLILFALAAGLTAGLVNRHTAGSHPMTFDEASHAYMKAHQKLEGSSGAERAHWQAKREEAKQVLLAAQRRALGLTP